MNDSVNSSFSWQAISFLTPNTIVKTYFMCTMAYFVLMLISNGDAVSTLDFAEYQLTRDCLGLLVLIYICVVPYI